MARDSRHFAVDDQPDVLHVRDRRRVVPALVGLPFLATAAYIWYGAWLILASHARAGTLLVPSGYLPMVLFLAGAGALFAWPGGRLTLHNRQVRIRRVDRVVEVIDDFLVLRRVRRRPLSDFSRVALQRNLRTPRGSTVGRGVTARGHRSVSVDLKAAHGADDVRVAFEYDADILRPLAHRVAGVTSLALHEALDREHVE